jgi:hypothetical protein
MYLLVASAAILQEAAETEYKNLDVNLQGDNTTERNRVGAGNLDLWRLFSSLIRGLGASDGEIDGQRRISPDMSYPPTRGLERQASRLLFHGVVARGGVEITGACVRQQHVEVRNGGMEGRKKGGGDWGAAAAAGRRRETSDGSL